MKNSTSLRGAKLADKNDATGKDPSISWQTGFDASWEVDFFGGKRRAKDAARYGLDAAHEDLRNTMLVLIGEVASNYSQVRASQARLSLAYRTAKSQREIARLRVVLQKFDLNGARLKSGHNSAASASNLSEVSTLGTDLVL